MTLGYAKKSLGITGNITGQAALAEWKRQTVAATRAGNVVRLRVLSQVKEAFKRAANRPRCEWPECGIGLARHYGKREQPRHCMVHARMFKQSRALKA
jgi:hypothetical protein